MLALLSLLAMLSDWVCFSVAPIPGLTQLAYSGVHPASLVTLFLFTNVFFCLVEPIIVKRYGLRDTIIFGAMLMALRDEADARVCRRPLSPPPQAADEPAQRLEARRGALLLALSLLLRKQ